MHIAFVGCGYVADFYMESLLCHPEIELVGVYDHDPQRLTNFSNFYSVDAYQSFESLINDSRVDIVINLTTPGSHYEISKASLMAGKHVYTEKPLAMTFAEAKNLLELAQQHNLYIASAPCSLLGESAQTVWKALREREIGKVYLAYAELDDSMIHLTSYKSWKSKSGIPWPYKNEFETGCTMEHAGYYLTWLTAFFGPANVVTSFSACLIPDKTIDVDRENMAPDFSVGCIEFESGVVSRLTCSIVADRDRSLTIVGDKGTLYIEDCWNYHSPVILNKRGTKAYWMYWMQRNIPIIPKLYHRHIKPIYPLLSDPSFGLKQQNQLNIMDFSRGIAELSAAIVEGRQCRLSAEHGLHVTELTQALQSQKEMGTTYKMKSTFSPIKPMVWAEV